MRASDGLVVCGGGVLHGLWSLRVEQESHWQPKNWHDHSHLCLLLRFHRPLQLLTWVMMMMMRRIVLLRAKQPGENWQ